MHFTHCMLAIALAGATATAPASQLFARGDFAGAKAAYAASVSRDPHDADALVGLARVHLYQNDLSGAVKFADAALALSPKNAAAKRVIETVRERRAILASADSLVLPPSGLIVPFVESEPLPAIEMRVNGKTGTFVIDTGAPELSRDPDFARESGLTITGGAQGVFMGGRTATVRDALVPKLEVGPIELANIKAVILPSRGMRMYKDRKIDGVVGTTFLTRFLSTMDYPNHRLVLRARTANLPADSGATSIPMWLVGDHFIFASGSVNGLTDQLFSIDSGGTGVGFMPVAATIAAAHIKTFPDKAFKGMGGGGPVTVIPTIAEQVCLGSLCQKNVAGYSPSGSPLSMFPFEAAGTVSHAFLEHYAVTFDFARMRMILAP